MSSFDFFNEVDIEWREPFNDIINIQPSILFFFRQLCAIFYDIVHFDRF